MPCFQQWTGINSVMFYAPIIFKTINPQSGALLATMITGVINVLATFISIALVERAGRKVSGAASYALPNNPPAAVSAPQIPGMHTGYAIAHAPPTPELVCATIVLSTCNTVTFVGNISRRTSVAALCSVRSGLSCRQ